MKLNVVGSFFYTYSERS